VWGYWGVCDCTLPPLAEKYGEAGMGTSYVHIRVRRRSVNPTRPHRLVASRRSTSPAGGGRVTARVVGVFSNSKSRSHGPISCGMLVFAPPKLGDGAHAVAPWVVPVPASRQAVARRHAPRDWPFFPIWHPGVANRPPRMNPRGLSSVAGDRFGVSGVRCPITPPDPPV
jgi:hypothetical protein